MNTLITILQILVAAALAPLLSGIIKKMKNFLRMRRGAPVLQPYYNLVKLSGKDEVISENTSWIFKAAPFVLLVSVFMAFLLVPLNGSRVALPYMGDMILVIFLLAIGRFFLALAGLDAGSAFGGMGSSREMFISSLVEPVMLLSLFAVASNSGSTNPVIMAGQTTMRISSVIAALSFFMAAIAETSRIPVDNQETHLELTMIHEAMVLEYSGKSLAMIEYAAHLKQMIFFTILASIIIPFGGAGIFVLKILAIAAIVSVLEISVAKMRLFRAVDFVMFALALSIMAMVVRAVGL